MTRKQALLAAIRDLLEEAKTLEAWMDDTAYPRRSRASWDESLSRLGNLGGTWGRYPGNLGTLPGYSVTPCGIRTYGMWRPAKVPAMVRPGGPR